MATKYPAAFDNFVNPTGITDLDTSAFWTHGQQHADLNDAVEALQHKVGLDSAAGSCVIRSERNISHTTKTIILLPSAPIQLAILWAESGTSGNLKFVLEAASSLDADARLANDSAHGEIVSGDSVLLSFVPSTSPTYIYLLASTAVGAGSNVVTIIAKVSE